MAEDLLSHLHDLLFALSKSPLSAKSDMPLGEALQAKGGFSQLNTEFKSGVSAAQLEAFDSSPDVAEAHGHAATAVARAQRHARFNKVILPKVLQMAKNSAKNKAICTAFALAGLHLLPNQDFNLSPLIDSALIAAGTIFGVEVTRDFKNHESNHSALTTADIDSLVKEMRKLDLKATAKVSLLASLNFYDSAPMTQATVLTALSVISTVGLYGLIIGIKYAEMKGLDWQSWESDHTYAKYWQKTGIPKLAGTSLIKMTEGTQALLPTLGRAAKAIAAGRLITKGMAMVAPVEARLDELLEHVSLIQEIAVKSGVWGTVGVAVGFGTEAIMNSMKRSGRHLTKRRKLAPSPQPASAQNPAIIKLPGYSAQPR